MNIVIFSHFFNVDGVIGSVRWTSFAKRLSLDNNIIVVSHRSNANGEIEIVDGIKTIYFDDECYYVKRKRPSAKNNFSSTGKNVSDNKSSKKNELRIILKTFLYMLSMKITAKKNCKKLLSILKKENFKVDYIISTSRPFIGALNGYYLNKVKKVGWLLDQRDLPYSDIQIQKNEQRFYKAEFKKFDKYVSKYTLVSKGMAECFINLMGEAIRNKVVVLYNGYNQEIIVKDENVRNNKLSFSCVGDLYGGLRDAGMLFDTLSRMIKNGIIKQDDIQMDYAGNDCSSLLRSAEQFGLQDVVINHGKVKHSDAVEIQDAANFSILLTWNTDVYKGNLPGKFYECMMIRKPIICLSSGNVPNGEAQKMVNDYCLGIGVSYAQYEESIEQLYTYLENQFYSLKRDGKLIYNPIAEKVNEFNYDNLVVNLKNIIGLN